MALESSLRNELEKEIEAEVEEILRRANEQGEALLQAAEKTARRREEEARIRLSEEWDLRCRRTLSRTELELRNALLRRREEELEEVFRLAAERISALRGSDPGAYSKLMDRILQHCRELFPSSNLRVRLGTGLDELGRRLSEEGLEVDIEEELFGIVVEADNGRISCNITVPRLLERLRRERQAELEKLLFGVTS